MSPSDLEKEKVYFDVLFADKELSKLLVQSYEYVGVEGDAYAFRALDPFGGIEGGEHSGGVYDGTIELTQDQVNRLRDLRGLISALEGIARST